METQAPKPPNVNLYLLTYPLEDLLWGRSPLKLIDPAARALQHLANQGAEEQRDAESVASLVKSLLPRASLPVKLTNRAAAEWLVQTYSTPKEESYVDWVSLFLKESNIRAHNAEGTLTTYDAMLSVVLDLLDHIETLHASTTVA